MKRVGAVIVFLLLLAVIASSVGVVYARQQSRVLFGELVRLNNERDDLNTEFGRLELEQATWAEPNRIEQVARGQLGMTTPAPADMVLIKK
ncbi:MAG: cell division protein FtsL [Rudaea sp.]